LCLLVANPSFTLTLDGEKLRTIKPQSSIAMPRCFHPSPQLFRIPEDNDTGEEDDREGEEKCIEGVIEEVDDVEGDAAGVLCPVVWVAILRDTCVLVDIGEEDVPDVVIETAQELLWETTTDNADYHDKTKRPIGWVEFCEDDVWRGLRYNEAPCWSFACVYNAQQISLDQCQRWMMDQVRWTASMRQGDSLWQKGGYHACQNLFAPLLQDRLQEAASAAGGSFYEEEKEEEEDEVMDLDVSPAQSPCEGLFAKSLFGERGGNSDDGSPPSRVGSETSDERTVGISTTAAHVSLEDGIDAEETKETVDVTFQGGKDLSVTTNAIAPCSPPRQHLHRTPTKKGSSPTRQAPSSPYKDQSTEELVKRLARKQAELDRQRQEEREKRASPHKTSPITTNRVSSDSRDSEIPHPIGDLTHPMVNTITVSPTKVGLEHNGGHDIDSGSMTSATAEDEEYSTPVGEEDDEPQEVETGKPFHCWFLPFLPRSKDSAISP
jgi:hypothetical protein